MPIARPPAPANSSTLRIEKPPYPTRQPLGTFELAFPNRQHFPPVAQKRLLILFVSFLVSLQLWKPKVQPGFRKARQGAGGVPMPETAVDENDPAEFPENDV